MGRPPKSDATNSKAKSKKNATKPKYARQGKHIFSLDIGTRTVIGIVGIKEDDNFRILASCTEAHSKRAMIDGQIEDINEVAKVVLKVKKALEDELKIKLTSVSIAAAGRALRTQHTKVDIFIDNKEAAITEEMVKSFELEAISSAQAEIDKNTANEPTSFYCVGQSVVSYFLDDYPIKSFLGHKGKKATVDLIAAFLPSIVVESLYSVMDKTKLKVQSLTLEPIAAMNVIIPPEIRLINVALVDIGAGTSDIAVSKGGSIVAYAMATIAGDEITEEIIKKYLVDFNTAEDMKQQSSTSEITYRDILGIEHTISTGEFYKGLYTTVDLLAETIVDNLMNINGTAPSAVFLVGGGSLVPSLDKLIAKKLGIDENRVAVGGNSFIRNIINENPNLSGPEYVTPIGIGVTATMQKGYDFSTITLNKKNIRIFDTKSLKIIDVLMTAGYKPNQIIGRSGRNLSFTMNGEKFNLKGELSTPAVIKLNGEDARLDTPLKQGDVIDFIPATSGMNASVKISDFAGEVVSKTVTISGEKYFFGTTVIVNDEEVDGDYQINNFDVINVIVKNTLNDIVTENNIKTHNLEFLIGDKVIDLDYLLRDNDIIITREKAVIIDEPVAHEIPQEEAFEAIEAIEVLEKTEEAQILPIFQSGVTVSLNGKDVTLERKNDASPNYFLELLNLVEIDLTKPQGNIVLKINGRSANYMDKLSSGDEIEIKWEE